MAQYFENDASLKSKKRFLKLYINDNVLSFESDAGVFSNDKIDYGSYIFLKTLLNENKVKNILDVGCGYGTLGITLMYFKMAQSCDMVDINNTAINCTTSNIKKYNLENTNCFYSDGFTNVKNKYDMIVINPPIRAGKKTIYKMFNDSKDHLNKEGSLYIVIKKDLGGPSAIKELEKIYNKVEIINKDKGYLIIKSSNVDIN